jgi:hypothetical protein
LILGKKGFNKEIQNNILRRQVLFVVIRLITTFLSSYNNIIDFVASFLYTTEALDSERATKFVAKYTLESFEQYVIIGSGILYFIIIFDDKAFKDACMNYLRTLTCKPKQKLKQEEPENISTNAFLCSTMNMEVVCAIL